ncbi:hypothetical protein HL658_10340 [Azospirillum sp. RWY-5-1]|uniref:Lipoprotein n=1 Tax=Azospirillum oleiclasticum TaxID=2735135 RepID=A0ABX2TAT6_9PROT|nr:hypothetical protein [Azospirillum oleiclasticum]NYZ12951.1 hypothetical protein [Azospirillum oleiclasticum]NYZ20376.1 hypothetical protein [Azospirillum oleiclasticum]
MAGWRVWSALLALTLAGCASSAEECDPNKVNNLPTAMGCSVFGGFKANLAQARADLEQLRAQQIAEQQRANAAVQTSQQLVTNRDQWQRRSAQARRDLDRLQLEISGLQARNETERARQQAMQEALAAANARLQEISRSNPSGTAELRREIEALERDVEARRRAVEAYNQGPRVE